MGGFWCENGDMLTFHLMWRGYWFMAIALLCFVCSAGTVVSATGDSLPQPERDLPLAAEAGGKRVAVFAGGCFWCVEAVFEQLNGVIEVISGYAGGTQQSAKYEVVSKGNTDHAEAIRVTYDPSKISLGTLLRVFFATHDPTQRDRQGPDQGRQYRSAFFYGNDEERDVARAYMEQLTKAGSFSRPIVTTLEPLKVFFVAEDYHQDFATRNPRHGYIKTWAVPKLEKLRRQYPDLVRETSKGD